MLTLSGLPCTYSESHSCLCPGSSGRRWWTRCSCCRTYSSRLRKRVNHGSNSSNIWPWHQHPKANLHAWVLSTLRMFSIIITVHNAQHTHIETVQMKQAYDITIFSSAWRLGFSGCRVTLVISIPYPVNNTNERWNFIQESPLTTPRRRQRWFFQWVSVSNLSGFHLLLQPQYCYSQRNETSLLAGCCNFWLAWALQWFITMYHHGHRVS